MTPEQKAKLLSTLQELKVDYKKHINPAKLEPGEEFPFSKLGKDISDDKEFEIFDLREVPSDHLPAAQAFLAQALKINDRFVVEEFADKLLLVAYNDLSLKPNYESDIRPIIAKLTSYSVLKPEDKKEANSKVPDRFIQEAFLNLGRLPPYRTILQYWFFPCGEDRVVGYCKKNTIDEKHINRMREAAKKRAEDKCSRIIPARVFTEVPKPKAPEELLLCLKKDFLKEAEHKALEEIKRNNKIAYNKIKKMIGDHTGCNPTQESVQTIIDLCKQIDPKDFRDCCDSDQDVPILVCAVALLASCDTSAIEKAQELCELLKTPNALLLLQEKNSRWYRAANSNPYAYVVDKNAKRKEGIEGERWQRCPTFINLTLAFESAFKFLAENGVDPASWRVDVALNEEPCKSKWSPLQPELEKLFELFRGKRQTTGSLSTEEVSKEKKSILPSGNNAPGSSTLSISESLLLVPTQVKQVLVATDSGRVLEAIGYSNVMVNQDARSDCKEGDAFAPVATSRQAI